MNPDDLNALLLNWRLPNRQWSLTGELSRAAQQAPLLPDEPGLLRWLVQNWAADNFQEAPLPPVVLVPASAMPAKTEPFT